jgi:hypothetical protein
MNEHIPDDNEVENNPILPDEDPRFLEYLDNEDSLWLDKYRAQLALKKAFETFCFDCELLTITTYATSQEVREVFSEAYQKFINNPDVKSSFADTLIEVSGPEVWSPTITYEIDSDEYGITIGIKKKDDDAFSELETYSGYLSNIKARLERGEDGKFTVVIFIILNRQPYTVFELAPDHDIAMAALRVDLAIRAPATMATIIELPEFNAYLDRNKALFILQNCTDEYPPALHAARSLHEIMYPQADFQPNIEDYVKYLRAINEIYEEMTSDNELCISKEMVDAYLHALNAMVEKNKVINAVGLGGIDASENDTFDLLSFDSVILAGIVAKLNPDTKHKELCLLVERSSGNPQESLYSYVSLKTIRRFEIK